MKLKLPVLVAFLIFSSACFSQSWLKEMQKANPNFYSVKKKADKYFKDEIREMNYLNRHVDAVSDGAEEDEGVEGYKIYKRWEEFWKPRINDDGSLPAPDAVYREMKAWQKKYSNGKLQTQGSWTPLGPFSVATGAGGGAGNGRVNGVAANPLNPNEIYACTPNGGVWKSTTGGNNWSNNTDQLACLGFSSVVVDYTNPNIIYAASGDGEYSTTYGLGVLKSTDGGATWNTTGLNWGVIKLRRTHKIIMDPVNPNVLIVATSIGLMRSTDGAATWTKILNDNIYDLEWKPGNSSIVYAGSATTFFRSTDNGQTFVAISSGLPTGSSTNRLAIAVTPANPDYVYVMAGAASNSGFYGMYRSTDGGITFTLRNNQPNVLGSNTNGMDAGGNSWYTLSVAADPTDAEHILTGGVNAWESIDGGVTYVLNAYWILNPNYNYIHADVHYLDFIGNTLYAGTDGGLFKSDDFGGSWNNLSNGLQITEFYRIGASASDPTFILGGAQDNGGNRLSGGSWDHWTGGDGFEMAVDPNNGSIIYGESQNGSLRRSTNGGNTSSVIGASITGTADWNTPFLLDNTGVMYVGRQAIWKSVNNGSSFSKLTTTSTGVLKFMAICKTAQTTMYATDGSEIYKINLSSGSVTVVTNGLSGTKSYIAVSDNDPDKVYVTISGFTKGKKIFRSTDGGLTWINISGNLPNIPATTVTCDNTAMEGIYVGTDAGVFYHNNNSIDWQSFMNGLPRVVIDELEINYVSNKIRAATYGRGMWESDLYMESAPVADFIEDRKNICPGHSVTFTDISTEGPTSRVWNFPGGNPATATAPTVTINYPAAGNYDVILTATNAAGSGTTTKTMEINVSYNLQPLPFSEGFESGLPAGWRIENPDNDLVMWQPADSGAFGASAHSFKCTNFDADLNGTIDNIVLPQYDLTSIANPTLLFDVAYARRNPTANDTLLVQASTDCGDSWQTLYNRGGNALKTTGVYYANSPFVPDATQWRRDTVSLASLASQSQVLFRFVNVLRQGNNIYLDNINIDVAAGINDQNDENIRVIFSPDPVVDISHLTINGSVKNFALAQLNIYNSLGQVTKTILPSSCNPLTFTVKRMDFNAGVFMYDVIDGKQSIAKGKFVIR